MWFALPKPHVCMTCGTGHGRHGRAIEHKQANERTRQLTQAALSADVPKRLAPFSLQNSAFSLSQAVNLRNACIVAVAALRESGQGRASAER